MKKSIVIFFFISIFILFIATVAVDTYEKSPALLTCALCDQEARGKYFYEDDLVVCMMPSTLLTPGHTIIAPKRHLHNFNELTEKELTHIQQVIGFLNEKIKHLYDTDDYILFLEKTGNKSHIYWHYIPTKPSSMIFNHLRWLYFSKIEGGMGSTLGFMALKNEFNQLTKENFLNTAPQDEKHSRGDQTLVGEHSK